MAQRPAFSLSTNASTFHPVTVAYYAFNWAPGMSAVQKRQNVLSLHQSIRERILGARMLEVSTKSTDPLGIALSAFNLATTRNGSRYCVESLYQASKTFENGTGPFPDLYDKPSMIVRKALTPYADIPLRSFVWHDQLWPLEPKLAFYTWLYCRTLHHPQNRVLAEKLVSNGYTHFTDIEYNPRRTLNSQSFAVAYYLHLIRTGEADSQLATRESFLSAFPPDLPSGFLSAAFTHNPTTPRKALRSSTSRGKRKNTSAKHPPHDTDKPASYAFDFS